MEAELNFKGGGFANVASENVKSAAVREHPAEDNGQCAAGDWPLKEKKNNIVDNPVAYLVLNHRLYGSRPHEFSTRLLCNLPLQ